MTPSSPGAPAMASSHPLKGWAFNVTVPEGTSADVIIDSVEAVAEEEVFSVQHLGASAFQVVVNSAAAMQRIVRAGEVSMGATSVKIESLGPKVTYVTCRFLPMYVTDGHLEKALYPYGKVLDISHTKYKDRPRVRNGDRVVKIEMLEANPVPNFLRVNGHRVTLNYRGMKMVCRRCRKEGHFKAACKEQYCERCLIFDHSTSGCRASCRRCGASHATADCTGRRPYSEVVVNPGDFPALVPPPASEMNTEVATEGAVGTADQVVAISRDDSSTECDIEYLAEVETPPVPEGRGAQTHLPCLSMQTPVAPVDQLPAPVSGPSQRCSTSPAVSKSLPGTATTGDGSVTQPMKQVPACSDRSSKPRLPRSRQRKKAKEERQARSLRARSRSRSVRRSDATSASS